MKVAYFDCFAGISGDMTLGALVDAGADFESLKRELTKLCVKDYELKLDKVVKHGITAADITVDIKHNSERRPGRSYSEIKRMIEESKLSDRVKNQAVAVFKRLGEAEAKIHGKSIEEIHFHEVGAVDAIVDIVGACICLELLGIDKVFASPVPTFHGMVNIAHGAFPLPAPATAELLKGVPWQELGIEGEIITPTGAAILAQFAESFGPMPAMTTNTIGYGAGKKDFGMPNVLRVVIGEQGSHKHGEYKSVQVIETNIDDISPQIYEVVMERLFDAGALDVYMTPIQMKKNRPAVLLSIICAPSDTSKMTDVIFEETSSIGVRISNQHRTCLPREMIIVDTKFGPIKLKVAKKNGEIVNAQPEYEDCKAAAAKHGAALKMVRDVAISEFLKSV
ncbi:MAG: nickel pincer cofactor biosynthesis protein LarC [Armatimonadetes bacterium]|nr:nickel pincer cofactor biosynthesis protein LarC [Armatimonadota bacterium]